MDETAMLSEEEKLELSQDFNFWSLMKFVFPSIFTFVFIAVYQMVDGFFIERFVGELAISAVNLYYPVICLFIALGIMLGTGGNAVMVKKLGEGKKEEANASFSGAIIFSVLVGIILTAVCLIFSDPIMKACGAKPENIDYLRPYYMTLSTFAITIILQSELGILIIGEGKSVVAAIVIMIGGVANCVLDYVFMKVFNMGIKGAALATVIGYLVTVVYAVFYYFILKKSIYKFKFVKMDFKELGLICFNGSSDMITNMVGGVSALIMNHLAYKFYGAEGESALSIALYLNFFIEAVFMGLTSAVEPIFSFHYGSGNTEMRKKIFKLSNIWVLILSVLLFALAFIFAKQLVGMFFDNGTRIYDITLHAFRISLFACFFLGFNTFYSGLFTAFSNGFISALLSVVRTLIILVSCLYALSHFFGGTGLWLAIPVSEVLSLVVCMIFIVKYRGRYEYW